MLQISKSYTFKQLCQKSDAILRNFINERNRDSSNEIAVFTENIHDIDESVTKIESEFIDYNNQMQSNEGDLLIAEVHHCDECSASFQLKVDLEVHKLEHQKEIHINEVINDNEVLFHCDICGKSFKGNILCPDFIRIVIYLNY